MIVLFRVDSSSVIGSGHLMRCLTLAKKFYVKEKAEIVFVCRDLESNLSQLVVDAGYSLILMTNTSDAGVLEGYEKWLTVPKTIDAKETCAVIVNLGKRPDYLVVDSYALDSEWERELRPLVEKIFVIDDLANRPHDCDILLDQNEYMNKESRYRGLVPEHCQLRLGYQHVLLRDEFYVAKGNLRKRDGCIRNILVFYGGSDHTNETMKALNALSQIDLNGIKVDVVVGGSNVHKAEVEYFCNNSMLFSYYCQVNNMAELMAKADLALGAGGSATWERLYLDLPSIVTAIAENQEQIARDCHVMGLIEYLGKSEDVDEVVIRQAVERRLVNGRV